MNATAATVVLSVLSAACYAVGAVLQERLAARTTATASGPLHRGHGLFRRGQGLTALGLNLAGGLLHVAALCYGPLSLVQPLGALSVVLAVPTGAALSGRRVARREWRGVTLALAGLAGLLPATTAQHPTAGPLLSLPQTCLLAGGCAATVVLLARNPAHSLRNAVAAGVSFAVGSALTQNLSVAVIHDGPGALLDPATALSAVLVPPLALAGVLLSQVAYRGGLGAPLVLITLANPVASCLIGLTVLGEHLDGGTPGAVCALAGAAVAACGVVLLCGRTTGQDDRPGTDSVAFPGL
ncbi:DMT family transporter [Streptomyces sp. NPDC003719]